MEERRRSYEDRPRSLLIENLLATAFAAHPYKWPTIGWMQDPGEHELAGCPGLVPAWYAPQCRRRSLVGDVEPDKVLAWARRYYGALAAKRSARKTLASRRNGG